MKIAERIVMVVLLLILLGGGAWIYFAVQHEQQKVHDAVARGEYERPIETKETEVVAEEDWRAIYPNTVSITVGGEEVQASVADTLSERMKGLSDTPFLPDGVVKLFAFGAPGPQSIWMKDMNYSLDIIWIDKDGEIVHIEENVSPDTYSAASPRDSKTFSSPVDAWYVVEAKAGFISSSSIEVGDEVVIPER